MVHIVSITKRFEFSCSHRLWNEQWSEEKNKEIFGKSVGFYGHGHNYVLFVTISGQVDINSGMIVNLSELKKIVNSVVDQFDHKFLNMDTPFFKELLPTLENIARVLFELIDKEIVAAGIAQLKKIRLQQGNSLSAEVWR